MYKLSTSLYVIFLPSLLLQLSSFSWAFEDYVDDGCEPPTNEFLAKSPWPMTHRNTYNQGSSPYAGPDQFDDLIVDKILAVPGSIALCYSEKDEQGNRVMWGHNQGAVDKIRIEAGKGLKRVATSIGFRLEDIGDPVLASAYNVLDSTNTLYSFRGRTLKAYANKKEDDNFSDIDIKREWTLPSDALRSSSDDPAALSMLYDGNLVFATREGMLGVINREFTEYHVIQLGPSPEEVSNNVAVDENNGIYIVSSKYMRRVNWNATDSTLSVAWESEYKAGPEQQVAGRIGAGSGTTPTLMGTKEDDDKFVVITDGETLMSLVLFWRDDIPSDWEGIGDGRDPRIAAEVPITFGDEAATTSVTEQSVLVRGYGAMVVNNDYGITLPSWLPRSLQVLFVVFTNWSFFEPYGVEKFEWDPEDRKLNVVWTNRESCPNGIPTMSAATGLAYCVGQSGWYWNIIAMDWLSGDKVFSKKTGIGILFNSAYAALEVGADRELVSGTLTGIKRVRSKS